MHALDEEEDLAYRAIERKYEVLYQKVYEKRGAILTGATMPDEATMAKFEEMKSADTSVEDICELAQVRAA